MSTSKILNSSKPRSLGDSEPQSCSIFKDSFAQVDHFTTIYKRYFPNIYICFGSSFFTCKMSLIPPVCAASSKTSCYDHAAAFRVRDGIKWRHSEVTFARMMRWQQTQSRVNSVCCDGMGRRSNLLDSFGKGLLGVSVTAAVALSLMCNSPALAESLTVAFPVSRAREVSCFYRTNFDFKKQLMMLYLQVMSSLCDFCVRLILFREL